MNDKIRDRIVQARVDFLMDNPFFGQLAVRLNLIEADDWCPTMAVDGYNMYYSTEFVNGMTDDELKFVVAHEIMHCVYRHFLRRESRNPRLWNCAGDYVINLELKDLKIGSMPKASSMPGYEKDKDQYAKMGVGPNDPGGLIDEKFRDMPTEEVYDIILEDAQNGGKHSNELMNSMDIHIDLGQPGGTEGEGGDEESEGKGSGESSRVELSEEEVKRLDDELKKAIIDAVKSAEELGGGAGKIPGGAKRLVKEWTESKVDWREYLNNTVLSSVKSDYTWSRSSRKGRDQGIYLPGMDNENRVEVHIAIDTSGSISATDIRDFLSEVKGIMDQFSDYKLTVWCFDTRTYTIHEYTPDNEDELEEFVPEGGGGTLFECNWEMMKEEGILPSTFIMFTDLYPGHGYGDPDYCDTVFLAKGNPNGNAPFGVTIHYEKESKKAA